jgi:hypothetical protein
MSSSGDESKLAASPRHEYEAIEKAVMESARGRWFLQEFAKRNRAADTLTLLEAIGRLQSTLGGASPGSGPPPAEIAALADVIKSTRFDMARIRNDMLPDGGTINDEQTIYAKIAEHAKATATAMMTGTQRLQKLAGELKAANANDEQVAGIETSAQSFQTLAWSQDVLSQRITKAMGLLSHVDERVNAMTSMVKPAPIERRHLKYFAPDDSLFEAPPRSAAKAQPRAEPPQPTEPKGATVVVHRVKPIEAEPAGERPPQPPAQAAQSEPGGEDGKKRIVIIRRSPGEPVEIPLTAEMPEQVA